MRFHLRASLAARAGALVVLAAVVPTAAVAAPRMITVNVEWRLDASVAPGPTATGLPDAGASIAVGQLAGSISRTSAAGLASLSVTVAEDALGSATYHSAVYGDLLVTVRPHVNANGTLFANILVRRTHDGAKTQVSTSQDFKGGAFVLLGRTSFSPPFASPGEIYANAAIDTHFEDPFAPHPDLGSGEAK